MALLHRDTAAGAKQQPKQQPDAAAQTAARAARTPCGILDASALPHGPNTPEERAGGRARRANGEGAGAATAQCEGADGADGAAAGGAAGDVAGEERDALERHLAEQRQRLDAERAALKARRASRGSLGSPCIPRASSVASLDSAAASDAEADEKEAHAPRQAPPSDKKADDERARREAGADGDGAHGDADADADAITPAVLGMGSPTMVPAGVQELVAQRLSRARKQKSAARPKRAEGLSA